MHMYIIRHTHIMHYYVCMSHIYIVTFPFFDVKAPFCISTAYDSTHFWIACLWLHVVHLWLFNRCSVLGGDTDFHHVSCHLQWPCDPLSYGSITVSGPGSKLLHTPWLPGHLFLDPGHLLHPTIITQMGALIVWRYVQIFEGVVGYMPNGAPLLLHHCHFS